MTPQLTSLRVFPHWGREREPRQSQKPPKLKTGAQGTGKQGSGSLQGGDREESCTLSMPNLAEGPSRIRNSPVKLRGKEGLVGGADQVD